MEESMNTENERSKMEGPRALQPQEHSSALRLINSAFRPNDPEAMQKEFPLVLGKDNIENMRVIVKGGEVVSHTAIYCSTLKSGDLTFKVGGISAVATHPAYRGRGLASSVMRDCVEVMRERGCHVSFLWTDRHDFYRNFGYEPSGSFYLFKPTPSHLSNALEDSEIVPYSSDHLADIIEIHDREAIRTVRTAEEYETYFGLPGIHTRVALRDNKVSAYAVVGKGRDLAGFMHDWGGDSYDLLCLAREMIALSDTGDIYVLAPACRNDLTNLLINADTPRTYLKIVMFSIIDANRLSSILSDHISSRLGRDFRIVQDSKGIRMKVGGEETYVEPGRMLTNILFGPEPPSSFPCDFSKETLSALDEALPIPLFIWGLDWV